MTTTWHQMIPLYERHLRAIGRRVATVRLYDYWLRRAAAELPALHRLSQGDLESWLAGHEWAPETRHSAVAIVKGFCRWLVISGALSKDPTLGLPQVRVPAGVPRPASETAVYDVTHSSDSRVRIAGILAARMGLRRAEIATARAEDVIGDQLLVRGKGGDRRLVTIHPALRPLLPVSGPLVPSLATGGHLTPGTVGRMLSAALPVHCTGHQLRHRFATVAYAAGRDIRAVQKTIGHKNLSTTQRYVDVDDAAMRACVLAA